MYFHFLETHFIIIYVLIMYFITTSFVCTSTDNYMCKHAVRSLSAMVYRQVKYLISIRPPIAMDNLLEKRLLGRFFFYFHNILIIISFHADF